MTLRLNGDSSGFTEIKAADAAGDNSIKLPASNGSANQLLQNGGTAGELQYTNAGSGLHYDSSGRLLAGTSSTGGTTRAIFQGTNATGSTNGAIDIANRTTNPTADTTLGRLHFSDANHNVGAVILGSTDGDWAVNDYPTRLVFATAPDGDNSPDEVMRITSDKYVRLASGTGGIQFNSDTAAANALDDYEEGTWTPTLTTSATDFDSVSYQVRSGSYTKIGDFVFVRCNFYTNSVTKGAASGDIRVTGLPFTCAALAAVCLHDVRIWDGNPSTGASIIGSNTYIALFKRSTFNGNDTNLQVSDVRATNPGNLCQFSGCYKIA